MKAYFLSALTLQAPPPMLTVNMFNTHTHLGAQERGEERSRSSLIDTHTHAHRCGNTGEGRRRKVEAHSYRRGREDVGDHSCT